MGDCVESRSCWKRATPCWRITRGTYYLIIKDKAYFLQCCHKARRKPRQDGWALPPLKLRTCLIVDLLRLFPEPDSRRFVPRRAITRRRRGLKPGIGRAESPVRHGAVQHFPIPKALLGK